MEAEIFGQSSPFEVPRQILLVGRKGEMGDVFVSKTEELAGKMVPRIEFHWPSTTHAVHNYCHECHRTELVIIVGNIIDKTRVKGLPNTVHLIPLAKSTVAHRWARSVKVIAAMANDRYNQILKDAGCDLIVPYAELPDFLLDYLSKKKAKPANTLTT